MRFAVVVLLLSLSACDATSGNDPAVDTGSEDAANHGPTEANAVAPQPKDAASLSAQSLPVAAGAGPQPKADLCWQDYCPCDDPVTALDHTICRNARGGVEMSDDQWSIGAMARDMKRAGDESNRQMDEVMRDARSQRQQLWTSQRSDSTPAPESLPASADQAPGEITD